MLHALFTAGAGEEDDGAMWPVVAASVLAAHPSSEALAAHRSSHIPPSQPRGTAPVSRHSPTRACQYPAACPGDSPTPGARSERTGLTAGSCTVHRSLHSLPLSQCVCARGDVTLHVLGDRGGRQRGVSVTPQLHRRGLGTGDGAG